MRGLLWFHIAIHWAVCFNVGTTLLDYHRFAVNSEISKCDCSKLVFLSVVLTVKDFPRFLRNLGREFLSLKVIEIFTGISLNLVKSLNNALPCYTLIEHNV